MPAISPLVVVFLGLGTTYALLFHLWRGKNMAHLFLFWLVSVLGFGLGYVVSSLWAAHPVVLAGIPVLEATGGSFLLLALARRATV